MWSEYNYNSCEGNNFMDNISIGFLDSDQIIELKIEKVNKQSTRWTGFIGPDEVEPPSLQ